MRLALPSRPVVAVLGDGSSLYSPQALWTAAHYRARKRAAAITLEEAAPRITGPLLVVHGRRGRLAPPHHAERLASHAPGAQLVMYPEGNHGITDQPFACRSMMADWLAGHLAANGVG